MMGLCATPQVSTLAASQANPTLLGTGAASDGVRRAEEFLKRRMGLRMTVRASICVLLAIPHPPGG